MAVDLKNISSLSGNKSLIGSAKEQLTSQAKDKVKEATLGKVGELKKKSAELAKKRSNEEVEYRKKQANLEKDFKKGDITEEEKNKKYTQFQENHQKALKAIDDEIKKTQDKIASAVNDPLKKFKSENKKFQAKLKKIGVKNKQRNKEADIARRQQLLKNTKKTLAPILIALASGQLIKILSQSSRLQELVDQTNALIDAANNNPSPELIQQAIIARNNAIAIINSQEAQVKQIKSSLETMQVIITIFNILVELLLSLSIPISPGGSGFPTVNFILKLANIIEKLTKLIEKLSVGIGILTPILNVVVFNLEDYKAQLHDINSALDDQAGNAFDSNPSQFGGGNSFPKYKGFRFAIKDDKTFTGRFKRHYAVAIDENNVEVLKSEYSFTLDPQDLIDQLKVVIDNQGLFTGPIPPVGSTPTNEPIPISKSDVNALVAKIPRNANEAKDALNNKSQ